MIGRKPRCYEHRHHPGGKAYEDPPSVPLDRPAPIEQLAAPSHRERIVEVAKRTAKLRDDLFPRSRRRTRVLQTDNEPAILVLSADWHFGGAAVDIAGIEGHLKWIKNTAGVWMLVLGDENENTVRFYDQRAVMGQTVVPDIQLVWLMDTFKDLIQRDKVAATGWSNHMEARQQRDNGYSIVEYMKAHSAIYFDGAGLLDLRVGDVEYEILMNHRWPGHSMYNLLHSMGRAVRELRPTADVAVGAHFHRPAISIIPKYGSAFPERDGEYADNDLILVATGTFQRDDPYSGRYFQPGIPGTPAIVFHHDRKHLVPFRYASDAALYLDGWRAAQKQGRAA